MDYAIDIFRQFFAFLDLTLANFISEVYRLFLDVATFRILEENVVKDLAGRLYVLIGIFMLFKLSFSFINYVANPDQMSDKEKGASKIIMNVLISLFLLVMTPTFFALAFDFQKLMVDGHVIPNIILGNGVMTRTDSADELSLGDRMAFTLVSSFVVINSDFTDDQSVNLCNPLYEQKGIVVTEVCKNKLISVAGSQFTEGVINGYENMKTKKLLQEQYLNHKEPLNGGEKEYVLNYMAGISTVVLIFAAMILTGFVIDIAVRTVKLTFLQLIAPVAVISYIDPKSSKSGLFSKWLKACMTSYLDLFIRLTAISFAIFIVEMVAQQTTETTSTQFENLDPFIAVAMIVGVLLFAKQLPQLLADLFGFKAGDFGFTINPLNKIRQTPILGKALGAAQGTLGGIRAGLKVGGESGHYVRALLAGALDGASTGAKKYDWAGSKDGKSKQAYSEGRNSTYKSLTGREMPKWSALDSLPKWGSGKELKEISDSKTAINAAKNVAQTELHLQEKNTAAIQSKMASLPNKKSTEYFKLEKELNDSKAVEVGIRSKINNYDKKLAVLSDQEKDVKRLFRIDESTKDKVEDAYDLAKNLKSESAKTKSEAIADTVASSSSNVTSAENSIADAQSEYNKALSKRQSLEAQLITLESTLAAENSQLAAINQSVQTFKAGLVGYETALNNAKAEYENYNQLLEQLKTIEASSVGSRKATAARERAEQYVAVQRAAEAVSLLTDDYNRAAAPLSGLINQQSAIESNVASIQTQINTLKNEIEECNIIMRNAVQQQTFSAQERDDANVVLQAALKAQADANKK